MRQGGYLESRTLGIVMKRRRRAVMNWLSWWCPQFATALRGTASLELWRQAPTGRTQGPQTPRPFAPRKLHRKGNDFQI
jgi:hypothetical protein